MTDTAIIFQFGNDAKNALIAFSASTAAFFEALGSETYLAVISAIILPAAFFIAGKAIDVAVQIYLARRREKLSPPKSEEQR